MNRSSLYTYSPDWTGSIPGEHLDADLIEERILAIVEQLQESIVDLALPDEAGWQPALRAVGHFFTAEAAGLYVSKGPGLPMELMVSYEFPRSAPQELPAGLLAGGDGLSRPPVQIQIVDNRGSVWAQAASDGGWQELLVYSLPRCPARLVLGFRESSVRRANSNLIKVVLRMVANVISIQQLRQQQRHLGLEIDKLRHMTFSSLDLFKEGVVLLDSAGRVIGCNELGGKTLGYSADEIAGLPAGDVLASWKDVNHLVRLVLSGKSSLEAHQLTLFHRFGEPLSVRLRIAPLRLPQHAAPFAAIAVFTDTQAGPMEEVEKNLREENARLERMMSILAHEIRNPLGSIKAGLDFLEPMLAHDPSAVEDLGTIKGEIGRMDRLLTDALLVTRPTELQLVPCYITDVLDELLIGRQKLLTERKIHLGKHYEPNLQRTPIDRAQMEQVFDNLIINAIHAMANGGHLALRVAGVTDRNGGDGRARSYVEVQITDSGPGIPPEIQSRIFDPFFTTKKGGTGLGLAVARRIVGLHNGTLTVQSWPEVGTIFTITLPVEEFFNE